MKTLTIAALLAIGCNGGPIAVDGSSVDGESGMVHTGPGTVSGEFNFGEFSGDANVEIAVSGAIQVGEVLPTGTINTAPSVVIRSDSASHDDDWGKLSLWLFHIGDPDVGGALDPAHMVEFVDVLAAPFEYAGGSYGRVGNITVQASIQAAPGGESSDHFDANTVEITTTPVDDETLEWHVLGSHDGDVVETTFRVRGRFDDLLFSIE